MSQIFTDAGVVIPVTVVEAGPCYVSQIKTEAVDGYNAVQLAYMDTKESRITKPVAGHLKKANVSAKKYLKEFKISADGLNLGSEIKCYIFAAGEKVDVSGVSKGKGFQGVIKRWNANRGPMSHGSKFHRAVGSMGASSDPSRTFKNKNMPGHMGAVNTTVLNLEVVKVIAEKNLILIKGGIPGPNKGTVVIRNAVKA